QVVDNGSREGQLSGRGLPDPVHKGVRRLRRGAGDEAGADVRERVIIETGSQGQPVPGEVDVELVRLDKDQRVAGPPLIERFPGGGEVGGVKDGLRGLRMEDLGAVDGSGGGTGGRGGDAPRSWGGCRTGGGSAGGHNPPPGSCSGASASPRRSSGRPRSQRGRTHRRPARPGAPRRRGAESLRAPAAE